MKEIWKQIKGFEGLYDISNKGRVRSWINKQGRKRKEPYIRKLRKNFGYVYCGLKKGDRFYSKRVHRLIADAFIPNPENKPCVNHKNGIKDDNRIDNLEWVTNSENDIHAFKNGLREPMQGEKNGHSVLIKSDILEIRKLYYVDGLFQSEIAEKFNVVENHISDIVNYKRWGHIGDKYRGMNKPVNQAKGESIHSAKLTPENVMEMRKIRNEKGISYKEIGEMFGVSRYSASRAIKGKTWSHV